MIVVCGGIKGGGGKTTVATNLVCIAASEKLDVLLVDADDQETSADFTAARKEDHPDAARYTCTKLTGKAVRNEVLELAPKYDHVIIDTGGRDTTSQRAALSVADVLLIPCAPRSFDVWAIGKVASLVDEMRQINPKLKAFVFVNKADPSGQGTENEDAVEMLNDYPNLTLIDAPLGNRKAFAHAASQSLAVTELKRPHRNQPAIDEMMALYRRCFDVNVALEHQEEAMVK